MADNRPAGVDPSGLRNVIGNQINPATEDSLSSVLTSVNKTLGLVGVVYNEVLITYTDSTKSTISTIVYKNNSTVVKTITYTSTTTQDDYVAA